MKKAKTPRPYIKSALRLDLHTEDNAASAADALQTIAAFLVDAGFRRPKVKRPPRPKKGEAKETTVEKETEKADEKSAEVREEKPSSSKHKGKYYVNHAYPGQQFWLIIEHGTERPTGDKFHYFKKRDPKEAKSAKFAPDSDSSSTTSSPQKKPKLAAPSPQKSMKPPTSGTIKTSPKKTTPAGPSAATAKSSPELPPLVTVKKTKVAVAGPEEKGAADITFASREVADKDLIEWREAPGRNPNILPRASMQNIENRQALLRAVGDAPAKFEAYPLKGRRNLERAKQRVQRQARKHNRIVDIFERSAASDQKRIKRAVAKARRASASRAARANSGVDGGRPGEAPENAATSAGGGEKSEVKWHDFHGAADELQLLKDTLVVQSATLREYVAGIDVDVFNLDEHYVTQPSYTEPVFFADGKCIYCKAHAVEKTHTAEVPHTSAECEYIKCGCAKCVLEEYFYEEEGYLNDPNPPRPLSEFADDPEVMEAVRHYHNEG